MATRLPAGRAGEKEAANTTSVSSSYPKTILQKHIYWESKLGGHASEKINIPESGEVVKVEVGLIRGTHDYCYSWIQRYIHEYLHVFMKFKNIMVVSPVSWNFF